MAFIGAKCFPTLIGWIKTLAPDYYVCINSHTSSQLETTRELLSNGFKVVALGNNASIALTSANVPHFKLPHPSGLNRQMNDKAYIDTKLAECRSFLNEGI